MHSLSELPFDVIQLIACNLLPSHIVALSGTCRTLRALKDERSVWLHVAERVSRSRPLPYTAAQALVAPLDDLIDACLRAERIARLWARPDVFARAVPIRIAFPDNRIITYFTFLPGTRHIMVLDGKNILSCWTTAGRLLKTWRVARGAKLARWKPCDEAEISYDLKDHRLHAVEIMIELQPRSFAPLHYELLLLVYSDTLANFEVVHGFSVPNVFEPFSAMTQDELRGSLVGIDAVPQERVGIYICDKHTEKAVCIDTGLTLVLDCVPQALLSSTQLVLYWETPTSAHTFTYEMDVLRSVIARDGRSQDDPALSEPVPVPPQNVRCTPFNTVTASVRERSNSNSGSRYTCQGCGTRFDQANLSTDLSRNQSAYPIIVPKWHTLREDLKQHRVRSILTLSLRPPTSAQMAAMSMYAMNDNVTVYQSVDDPTGNNPGPSTAGDEHEAHTGPQTFPVYYPSFPRTTITHHYFDCSGSASGCGQTEVVRTVLAEAPLRRPQSLRIPENYVNRDQIWEGSREFEEIGVVGLGEDAELHDTDGEQDVGLVGAGPGILSMESIGDANEELVSVSPRYNSTHDHEYTHYPNTGNRRAGQNSDDVENLGLVLGDLQIDPHMLFGELDEIASLSVEASLALEPFMQDPFGGSPVMGYGGRCAMWVEEHPTKSRPDRRRPVLRLATFPSFDHPCSSEPSQDSDGFVYPELEDAAGRVSTLHVPDLIRLESAYAFDLDDVRGVVGIATSFGGIWLVDFGKKRK